MVRSYGVLPALLLSVSILTVLPAHADPPSELVGRWRWVRSTDYLNGEVETPASTGEERVLAFRSSGEYASFVNGTPRHVGTWSIQSPPMNCDGWGLQIDGFVWCAGVVTESGSLLVLDGSLEVDGPVEEYEWLEPILTDSRSWSSIKSSATPRP